MRMLTIVKARADASLVDHNFQVCNKRDRWEPDALRPLPICMTGGERAERLANIRMT
jgi:hypothetical protein